MGGNTKIFTPAVIKRAPPFPYLRSKVGTLSEASPLHSGKISAATASLLIFLASNIRLDWLSAFLLKLLDKFLRLIVLSS